MKILAISQFYKPIWPGFGTRSPQLVIDGAAKSGNEVIVLTGTIPTNIDTDQKYRLKKLREKIGNGSIEINRLWVPESHQGFIKRSIIYFYFIFQCFFKMLTIKNIDLVIGLHPYPPFFIPIILLSKLKKTKFILYEADLWPNNLIELGLLNRGFLYSIIKKLSGWSYNNSHHVIVITEEIKKNIQEYFDKKDKVIVLNMAVDTTTFKPEVVKDDRYAGKFVVMYNGIFSPNYDFDIIINAAKIIDNEKIIFVISGSGELKKEIVKKIQKLKLNNIKIENPVPTITELVRKLNRADILVLGMHDNLQAKTAHPSKVFEYMACGKPIICSTIGATEDILVKANAGIVVKPGDYHDFTSAILRFYNSKKLREEYGKNGREFTQKNYSLNVFQEGLNSILKNLMLQH